MTINYISTITTSASVPVVMGATVGLKEVVLATGFVGSTNSNFSAFTGSGANQGVTILGTAVADGQSVIYLSGTQTSVKVGSGGQVLALEPEHDGVATVAIYLPGGGTVENAGTITAQTAVDLNGGVVQNSGTINGSFRGIYSEAALNVANSGVINSIDNNAIYVVSSLALINTGAINGGVFAIDGLIHNAGDILGKITLTNSGSVWNSGTIGDDVVFGETSSVIPLTWNLFNRGTIDGNVTTSAFDGAGGSTINVHNYGTISGSVSGLFGDDRVVNSGTLHDVNLLAGLDKLGNLNLIDGTVDFGGGSGADILRNAGTITGNVLGLGSDGATVHNSGRIEGALTGSTGADVLINSGYIGDIGLGGGSDQLTFAANGYSDSVVHGDTGNDLLQGARADDSFSGDAGNDILRGFGGDDSLSGGTGNDKLFGGSGEDVLTGGVGKDELSGGSGADMFVFSNVAGASAPATFDIIRDFSTVDDLIDLRGNGLVFASYLGTAAFANNGAPQVRYVTDGAGGVNIQIDLNGNTSADAVIHLDSVSALTRGDFLF